MAFMKSDLTGPFKGKAALVNDIKRNRRIPGPPKRSHPINIGAIRDAVRSTPRMPRFPDSIRGMPINIPDTFKPPRFDMGNDIMQMPPRGPQGFPGMGDYNPGPWQTQQPGFYDEDQLGPEAETLQRPPMPPRSDTALRPPWEGRMPPGGVEGQTSLASNPVIMRLIQEMMRGRKVGPSPGSYF